MTVSDVKRDLHACMNGVASAAMRQSDDYRVNFGVELPRLERLADEIDASLAPDLWKESVRECRILALMIQRRDDFSEELCDVWIEQIHTAEIAQIASMCLFQYLDYAVDKSLEWIASDEEIKQICGFTTLWKIRERNILTVNNITANDNVNYNNDAEAFISRTLEEIIDQAQSAVISDNLFLKKIAQRWTSISRHTTY